METKWYITPEFSEFAGPVDTVSPLPSDWPEDGMKVVVQYAETGIVLTLDPSYAESPALGSPPRYGEVLRWCYVERISAYRLATKDDIGKTVVMMSRDGESYFERQTGVLCGVGKDGDVAIEKGSDRFWAKEALVRVGRETSNVSQASN